MSTKNRSPGNADKMKRFQYTIKRVIDFCASLTGMIILSPLLLIVAVLIKITDNGPLLFCQDRLGKDATIFKLYKFRTMVPNAVNMEAGLSVTENDKRITRVGKFLRKTSLDELPQLFNVINGDISLVGPRPAVPQHLEYYGQFERKRLQMRPGITGLAMVRGRASIPWSQRIKYDVEYVEKFSLCLDLKILIETFPVVLKRKNTYYDHEKYGPAFDLATPNKKDDNAVAE